MVARMSSLTLSLGPLTLSPPLVLAPMAGVTDRTFRRMVRRASAGGLGLVYTEFVSIEGLTRGVRRTLDIMALGADEHPAVVQIYGRDIERMAEAARLAEASGADAVDINAGCPARKIVARGGGVALMKEPEHLQRLVAAVRAAVRCPVTVKIRVGWDAESLNAVEVAQRVVDAGAVAVTVHGRTRAQGYSGQADWGLIRAVREAVPVPVIGNGDVADPAGALQRWRDSGVAGLMIGRAAMGNPWVFRQIYDALQGREPYVPRLADRLRWWLDYGEALLEELPERALPGRLKQLAAPMTRGLPHAAGLRREVYACTDGPAIRAVLERCLREAEEGGGEAGLSAAAAVPRGEA